MAWEGKRGEKEFNKWVLHPGFFSSFIYVEDFTCFIQEPSTAGHCQNIKHQGSSALIKLPARSREHRTDQYIMWESSANHLLNQCLTACLQK